MEEKDRGICFIAGAGPGDKDLITKRVYDLISQVDVIVYDDLVNRELLKRKKTSAELIYVGKRSGRKSESQDVINSILVEKTGEGKKVLRLKGGDPFVFGRGSEECEALRDNGLRYTLIPGITSAVSVPELAGIPVTHRGVSRSFTVITGHKKPGDEKNDPDEYIKYAKSGGTLVFLMGLENIGKITTGLNRGGLGADTPVAVISSGTTVSQHVVRGTIADIEAKVKADEKAVTPAIIVIGELAARDYLNFGNPVIITTGTQAFVEKQRQNFLLSGIKTVSCPHLRVKTYEEDKLEKTIDSLKDYTHIAFVSQHSVSAFMDVYLRKNDIRALSGIKIACLGDATSEYLRKEYGLKADLVPREHDFTGMAKLILKDIESTDNKDSKANIANKDSKVLILRAKEGDRSGNRVFEEGGAAFDDLSAYCLEADTEVLDELSVSGLTPDYLTFGSTEGVKKYAEHNGPVGNDTYFLCVGRYTAEAVREIYKGIRPEQIILTKESKAESFVTAFLENEER